MDKLFNYSKIVSCIALLTTPLYVASFCVRNPILAHIVFGFTIALYVSISLWFGIIAIKSVKGSSLKLPSILGIAFSAVIIFAIVISNTVQYNEMNLTFFLRAMQIRSYLTVIGSVGLGVVFLRLSKFFNKKLINTLAKALGILLLLYSIGFTTMILFNIPSKIVVISKMIYIINIFIYALYSVFFFFFSKYNK